MNGTVQARRALVLYGSETGNAQDVAEEMGRIAERLRFDTEVVEMDAILVGGNPKRLLQYNVVLFAISTTGQGELPANSQGLWRALRRTSLKIMKKPRTDRESKQDDWGSLWRLHFASFGLGDSSYPKFNWAHIKLWRRLLQLGAQSICDSGQSDEQHPEGVDGSFLPWSTTLRQSLLEKYPLPEGLEPIPDDVLLDPKRLLAPSEASNGFSTPNSTHTSSLPESLSGTEESPPLNLLNIQGGLTAEILSNNRLTPRSHWQDVRHLTLNIASHHPYVPGDVLTIYPKNFPSDVSEFIKIMHWESIADDPFTFVPSSAAVSPTTRLPLPHLPSNRIVTLRELLTNHLDIMSIPRRSFFAQLAHFTDDEFHKERLLEFTNPEYIDELYDYTTRPRRSILEVLQEFESVKIPWQRICSIIPAIRGRQFSIASAQSPRDVEDGRTRIELLIAIVKYRTVIKRTRQGVCTRYVSSLKPGQEISVTLQRGGLGVTRKELDKPVVMVGPGTGVAPMRSLIYQRKIWREEMGIANDAACQDMLFFGCRNAEADYYFEDEWEKLKDQGTPLDVFAAFSRDQRQKVYVQDLVRQQSARIYDALANHSGLVYICGSSGKMPQAVREALIEAFQAHGNMTRENAEVYLKEMEKKDRYKQETW